MIRVVLALVLVATAATQVTADPAAADAAAAEANALAEKGSFVEAAAKFREAWKADPLRPTFFCNIGISLYQAGKSPLPNARTLLARSHLLLGQCLEQSALEQKTIDGVRGVLAAVENELRKDHAPVRVVPDPNNATAVVVERAEDEFVGAHIVWLPLGTHHVRGRLEGYEDTTVEVTVKSTDAQTVPLALHKKETVVVVPPIKPILPPPRERPSKLPAILATGGTVLALGISFYAFRTAHDRADLARTALDVQAFEEDKASVDTWNTTLAVSGVIAIAGAAASGYLWYRALHTSETHVEVQATGDRVGFVVGGRF